MMGFEHSIANLFLLPLGVAAGAEVSVMDMVMRNIVPVTIGNILAGESVSQSVKLVGWSAKSVGRCNAVQRVYTTCIDMHMHMHMPALTAHTCRHAAMPPCRHAAVTGAVIFAGSYSYLYGALGGHTKD